MDISKGTRKRSVQIRPAVKHPPFPVWHAVCYAQHVVNISKGTKKSEQVRSAVQHPPFPVWHTVCYAQHVAKISSRCIGTPRGKLQCILLKGEGLHSQGAKRAAGMTPAVFCNSQRMEGTRRRQGNPCMTIHEQERFSKNMEHGQTRIVHKLVVQHGSMSTCSETLRRCTCPLFWPQPKHQSAQAPQSTSFAPVAPSTQSACGLNLGTSGLKFQQWLKRLKAQM
eukprot:1162126-Pelagomonas_calceolata.AAC.7